MRGAGGWIGCAATLIAVALFCSCSGSKFRDPQRDGPPALVTHAGEPQLWLVTKQEEARDFRIGRGAGGQWRTEDYYHFDLHIHDPLTTARISKQSLLILKDDGSGHASNIRILGQDGDVVWLFVHDQPMALSSKDGSRVAGASDIEAKNPALKGLLSKESKYFLYDAGLIVITVDGQRFRVRGSDLLAEPYTPESDRHFNWVESMTGPRWNGGYETRDFVVSAGFLGGKWLGLLTEKEAAYAADDTFGSRLAEPSSLRSESSQARRTFWNARISKVVEFPDDPRDRLFDLTKIPGAGTYLDSGMLIQQGTQEPLISENPRGLFVVHRTRIDAEGVLAITRLDESLKEVWTAKLPLRDIRNRFTLGNTLLFYGTSESSEDGYQRRLELMTSLNLATGATQSWNVTDQKPQS